MSTEYAFEPNRLRADGATDIDTVALSLRVTENAITIETRESAISQGAVELPYEQMEAVRTVREVTYTVVFETTQTEYVVTNVSPDRGTVRELVDYVRQKMAGEEPTATAESADAESEPAVDDASETELDEWTWGETSDADPG